MATVLVIIGAAFAAFCIWLAVRIVNRREWWAKWTAAGLSVVVAYPLSFGPACWISSRTGTGAVIVSIAYQPVIRIIFEPSAPDLVVSSIMKYAELLSAPGWMFSYTGDPDHVDRNGHSNYRCHWSIVL
jgi:hypothetical protein